MAITAAQVKELRQSTGVGMMECKKALVENDGDMDKAIRWLREKGMARAAKKAGRTAAEGVVEIAVSDSKKEAAIVELNCETDFAGKNEDFRAFAEGVTKAALDNKINDIEALKALEWNGSTVEKQLTELIGKVGENMSLRRVNYASTEEGVISGYSHMGGKIGTLVVLSGDSSDKAIEVGNDLAMHVAASAPKYLNRDSVSGDELEQEKEIARKRLKEQGKPDDIIEKALMGQVNKFYGEVCFVDQPFVKEPKLTVNKYVKQAGVNANISSFVRFQLGEGIEVKQENFAEEVAAQLKK
ncbi:MAG: elongation factor Ts [Oligoflexales bacterium]|nr:elongation factor Ts [Oligoflexales bacterium]